MLYIRTDMNRFIATGHMMRCLSIADAAADMGEETMFLLSDNQAQDMVRQRGHHAIVLNTDWNDMEQELHKLLPVISSERIEKLFIDSYQVTERYLQELRSRTKTIYLDDLNKFIYPVDGLICYANYWKKMNYPKEYGSTKLYLGPRFVPLRKVFSGCGRKQIREKADNLLLLSGGSDPYHVLKQLLYRLERQFYTNIYVVCGRYNTDFEELRDRYGSFSNIHLLQSVADIEEYMKAADIAVSAGGTSLYELCACGTPTVSYSFADNQLDNVRQFESDGMIAYAGDAREDNLADHILLCLNQYRENRKLRQERSLRMQSLVDGNGARRIASAVKEL